MSQVENESPHVSAQDYALIGGAGERARAAGLVNGAWYRCAVPRATMKALMQRSDGPAIRDTLLWLALIAGSGALAFALRGSAWCIPAFIVYGALYGGSADSRWHEAGHGTAFRTRWMNEALYQLASFMILRRPTVWRWSHARHHSDTLVTGRDPEIAVQRPPSVARILANVFALESGPSALRQVLANAFGRVDPQERSFIPESEHPRVVREARAWLVAYAAVAACCVATASPWPLMFVGLPSFYGAWLYVFFGLTQHAGLPENTLDHRLNCRTIRMNPVFRFLYWNMNYHVEHHMFPMVPYHALPRLHEEMKQDCPPPYPGIRAAYRELVPAVLRQRTEPAHHIVRPLPTNDSKA
ncbi:fatty acid desaturase family protein [Pelomonas sp. KK5]|uniref:fatty acid desaturase family protein n=1 Tax=Pelomonas sp. KK5 TaxID=1855730 RepID=UPI00097C3E58|nr:fatty acid desaturase family protein [Pelomonas sp. KK5]